MHTPWIGGTPLPLSLPNGTWATRYYWENGLRSLNNGELHWLSDETAGVNPFSITNGVLNITATPSPGPALSGGYPYISGLISTEGTFAQTYGYFEVRAQLPAGKGLWPSFWLLPQDHTWPPELDMFEVLGNDPTTLYNFLHTGESGQDAFLGGPTKVANLSAGFHTFGLSWAPDVIQWFVDGQLVRTQPTPADMHKPMYLLAALGVGGEWPGAPDATTPFPATMSIDYVRAYRAPGLPPEAMRDYDADGQSDLLFRGADGTLAIWTMNGTAYESGTLVNLSIPGGTRVNGGADMNGDKRAELLVQDGSGQPGAWFLDEGRWLGGATIGPNPGPGWRLVGAADLDGDGKSDLLWQHGSGQAAIWTMDGMQPKAGLNLGPNPGPNWQAEAIGDLNGDRFADIIWQDASGRVATWFMQGTQLVSDALLAPDPGPDWQLVGAADMNDDGRADILFQHADGRVAAWFMNGSLIQDSMVVGPNPGPFWELV